MDVEEKTIEGFDIPATIEKLERQFEILQLGESRELRQLRLAVAAGRLIDFNECVKDGTNARYYKHRGMFIPLCPPEEINANLTT